MWTSTPIRIADRELISQFTRETGIAVQSLPAPEATLKRLNEELESAPTSVDVIEFDLAWSPRLTSRLADLRNALSDRFQDELPGTVESVRAENRILGAPFFADYGLLFYRTDLLRKYGFKHPPATWKELETQARVIQRGERASGRHDFWGYVWQGAAYEGLTCNALEWQYSHGGGNFIGRDGKPNLANPKAIEAFSQAAHWVGTISPPGILAYTEEDSRNIWQSGNAAFVRTWSYVYGVAKADPNIAGRFAVSVLPSGSDPHSNVFGGWYLGVPASSRRQSDAIAFVRYMTSLRVQLSRAVEGGYWPTLKSAYADPKLKNSEVFGIASEAARRVIDRPIAPVGALYPCISDLYARGVHNILTRKTAAGSEARRVEEEITSVLQSGGKQGCP